MLTFKCIFIIITSEDKHDNCWRGRQQQQKSIDSPIKHVIK